MIKADDLVLPAVAALHPYEPGKPIEEVQRELGIGEPAKLASNENPAGPSPLAVAAIRGALGDLHRYPDGSSWALRHKLAIHCHAKAKIPTIYPKRRARDRDVKKDRSRTRSRMAGKSRT